VVDLKWGEVGVEGLGTFKDVKLYPGGAIEWDWSLTGTRHVPGVQQADVTELVGRQCRVVVLTRGMLERLQVTSGALEFLASQGVEVHVEETRKAVELYNRLATEGKAVGALVHSTC